MTPKLGAQNAGPFARGAVFRTILKDVAPDTVNGSVLFHEHLSIRYPPTKTLAQEQGRPVPVSFSDDIAVMVEETKAAVGSTCSATTRKTSRRGPPITSPTSSCPTRRR